MKKVFLLVAVLSLVGSAANADISTSRLLKNL